MTGRRHRDLNRASGRGPFVVEPTWFDPSLVSVRLADDSTVPSSDQVSALVTDLSRDPSCRAIRTSAVFPAAADVFVSFGFGVVDTLALLRAELRVGHTPRLAPAHRRVGTTAVTATIRRHEFGAAAAIDQAAFGPGWGHDASELRAIRQATPTSRVRVRTHRDGRWQRRIVGFAIAGATHSRGYLQRLSVSPDEQRRGHGEALTTDALAWMRERGVPDCLVNTSVDNERALALYAAMGFTRLPDELRVLSLDLRSGADAERTTGTDHRR